MPSTTEEITPVIEEYLECIYRLEEKQGVAKTKDIVEIMGVAPGTVTNTVKWLERNGLVVHRPYHGVNLTSKGRRIAIQVLRRHRLAERLLVDILRIKWEESHELACKLEHNLTEEIIRPLEAILKNPKTCPHGNPIPTEHEEIIEEETISLVDLDVGARGAIIKIVEERRDLLNYLSKLGILPGVFVKILERNPLDGSIIVMIREKLHVLSSTIASVIYVKKVAAGNGEAHE